MSFLEIFDLFAAFMINNAWSIFLLVLFFSAGILWVTKPWRMTYVAAAVVNIPLAILYMLSFLFVLVPFMNTSEISGYNSELFFHPVFMIFMVVAIAPIGYALLRMIDKDREKAPKNEFLYKILNGAGIGLILVFFLWVGFTGIVNPMFIFEEFSLRFVAIFFVFIGTMALFARFVLVGLLLALGANDPYVKVVKPYIKWIYVAIVGSALLGFSFYLIDQLI